MTLGAEILPTESGQRVVEQLHLLRELQAPETGPGLLTRRLEADKLQVEEFHQVEGLKVSRIITIAVGGIPHKIIPPTRRAVPATTVGITAAIPTIVLLRIPTMEVAEEVHQLIQLRPGVVR